MPFERQLNRAERRARGASQGQQIAHCHVQVKKVAEGLAGVLWEKLMLDDKVWAEHKATHPGMTTNQMERAFVQKLWPQLLEQARSTMAAMLAPGSTISDDMKEEIMDALVRDKTLMDPSGGRKFHQVLGQKK